MMMTLNIINVEQYHLLVSFKMWREPIPGILSLADDMGGEDYKASGKASKLVSDLLYARSRLQLTRGKDAQAPRSTGSDQQREQGLQEFEKALQQREWALQQSEQALQQSERAH